MAAGYGFAGHIGFAKETSGGTAVAAAEYIEAMSESLDMVPDRFETKNIIGRYSEAKDSAGVERVGGDIVVPFHPVELGFFLNGAMGVQSGSVVLSGFLWTNEFLMANADWDNVYPLQPFTFEISRDVTSAQQYAGCNIGALQIVATPNQDIRCTASIIGKAATQVAATTPSYTSSPANPMGFDTVSLQIGGAATEIIESITFNIDNQLQGVPTLNNSKQIRAIRRTGPQLIRISGSVAFENITEMQAFRDQTEQALVLHATRADSFSLTIDVPQMVYTTWPAGMAGRDRQVVGFEANAEYHVTSVSAIKIDLTTTRSAY